MATKIYVNLPVKNLTASIDFFTKCGFSFNPKFSGEGATCMIISENIYAMLLTHERFKDFTPKQIADATKTTEVLVCLSLDSKQKVDELVELALANGAKATRPPQDYGFMYGRSFDDLDGHIWEIIWVDEVGFPKE